MSAMSDYLENELLDHALGTGALTSPASIYLALFTTDPTDADSGTEVSGNGYARQEITFGAAASGTASNSTEETFTASGGNFGTITHFGIYDAATAGNLLFHGGLTTSRTINDGDTLTVPVGAIDITFD